MNELSEMLVKGTIDGVKEIAKELIKSAAHLGQKELKKTLLDFQMGFGSFLDRNYKRVSRIKTLLNPASPVSLEATFVPPSLIFEGKIISENELIPLLIEGRFVVITGIGGSGKSVLLKHLFITFYQGKRPKICDTSN